MSRASDLLLELHATPELAAEVFYQLRVGLVWTAIGPREWHRDSLAYTAELNEFGREYPIARVIRLDDGTWRAGVKPDQLERSSVFAGAAAAMAAEDKRLAAAGWSLVAPATEEASW